MPQFSSNAVETIQLTRAGEGAGPGGWDVNVAIAPAWSGSLIFKNNQAPPGQPVNLVAVPYYNSKGQITFAGNPVTVADDYTIPETGYDLWVLHLWSSGTVRLDVDPATAEVIPKTVQVTGVTGTATFVGNPL